MSERPEIRLTAEEQAVFLRENRKAALATLDKDGFPHVVAMTYLAKDGAFYMTSYGKAQKVVNIRRDPKVGLMVESGGSYSELRGVMVRGICEIIDDAETVADVFAWMAEARGTASNTPRRSAASTAKRVVLKVVPHKLSSWDHAKLGGRY